MELDDVPAVKRKLRVGDLAIVEWTDSYGCSPRWQEVGDLSPALLTCESVGWVIADSGKVLVVLPHRGREMAGVPAQGCGDMTIPWASVLRTTLLRRGKGR